MRHSCLAILWVCLKIMRSESVTLRDTVTQYALQITYAIKF